MLDKRSVIEPTQVGIGTIVRWIELHGSDLKSAMKSLAGGGAKHPYISVFHMLSGLANNRIQLERCRESIKYLPAKSLQDDYTRVLNNFIRYMGAEPRIPIPIVSTQRYVGPNGVLSIGTRSHFRFERHGRTHWGLIWNNKSPRLDAVAARLGCSLMRQGVEANDNDLFDMIDVRNGKVFSANTVEIDDDYYSMRMLISRLENDYERLAG